MKKVITDDMFYQLVDYKMSEPISLNEADLSIPFIYDREYGVFYISGGMHLLGMALLYCWKFDALNKRDLFKKLPDLKKEVKSQCYSSSDEYQYLADQYLLKFKGTAMGSSVSDFILIGKLYNLNENEKIVFSRFDIKELN